MKKLVPHSTPKCRLSATKQAARELGDSQRFSSAQFAQQLTLPLNTSYFQEEAAPYLQITSVPIKERINPREHRYYLMVYPQRVRACGAQFTAEEAHEIEKITKAWDWSLDAKGRLRCLPALEYLLDRLCQRSFQEKGGGQ